MSDESSRRAEQESTPVCLPQLIQRQSEQNPGAAAILAPGRRALSYGELSRHVEATVSQFNARGIGRNDRVATVLPEGPEAVVAHLAVAAAGTCAPLNPAYPAAEFQYYLTDLDAQALLVMRGSRSPAVAVARSLGIPVLELVPQPHAAAGLFTMIGEARRRAIAPGPAQPDDVALALYTSGTSARPKLVPLTHRNICAAAKNICTAVELTATDRCLNVMPLFHIHGLSTVYATLTAGGSLVATPDFSAARFFEWLDAFCPTWYSAAPAIHQMILDERGRHREICARARLRFIRSASGPMPRQTLTDLEQMFGSPFIEAYGMTEAAPQIASNRLTAGERKAGSVGRPAGPEVAILNEAGQILAAGETGEVVIRGENVIRAYENDPTANETAFVRGWLRTGDQGRLDAEGFLFLTGRLKEFINRGGEKISPRSIEEVLLQHPAVAQAVTFAVPDRQLGETVAAAIVVDADSESREPVAGNLEAQQKLIQQIRSFAAARLAHFKVPQQIVIVDAIPHGPAGKLQRKDLAEKLRLAEPIYQPVGPAGDSVEPRTPAERKLAEIWSQVLHIGAPGVHDHFFNLGGNSLAATRVVARVRDAFHVDLPLANLFENPTVAGLADLIGRRLADLVAEGTLLRARHSPPDLPAPSEAATIPRRGENGPCPLSFAQQRLWFMDRIEAGNAYNMSASLRLIGSLDVPALERSLNEIWRRHDVLRTTFPLQGGNPVQRVAPARPLELTIVDLTTVAAPDREAAGLRLANSEAERPFDLACGPLFRAALVRLRSDEHLLLLTMHHIISDGWSTGVLHRELALCYESFAARRTPALPDLPIQYADFSVWQRDWLRGDVLARQLAWWQERLRDLPTASTFPSDRPRPATRTYRGSTWRQTIDRRVTANLKALCRHEDATLFMTLLAAFKMLLFRYSGQEDCVVGTPIANRTRRETELLIGFFANTLVMRTDLSGDPTFSELLERIRANALGAFAHQDLPFEKLVETLHPERDASQMPFFRVMFAFQNLPVPKPASGNDPSPADRSSTNSPDDIDERCAPMQFDMASGLAARPLAVDSATAKFDLTLYLSESGGEIAAAWRYNSDLFERATIERVARHFATLLERVAGDATRPLSELTDLPEPDRRQIVVDWNLTEKRIPPHVCFHHAFESQAQKTPFAPAVVCGGERLTYQELNARANQLARHLQKCGVAPGRLVGVCLPRSANMLVALLGVSKAGAGFLALDPEYPAERRARMCRDAQTSILITERRLVPMAEPGLDDLSPAAATGTATLTLICLDADADAIGGEETANPTGGAAAGDLAYVIYTSGSTGAPKGVMMTHGNVRHYVEAMREALGVVPGDRYLHAASFAFSSSVRQFAVPLCCGAAVVIATAEQMRDPQALLEFIRREQVTIVDFVPSYWQACVQVLRSLAPASRAALLENEVRLILSASEPLPVSVATALRDEFGHAAQLMNMFGQTETTGIVTVHPIPPSGSETAPIVPIGRPIANTRVYLLDRARRPVPVGVWGEICIAGGGVGQGYLHQPHLTAERFIPDPFGAAGGGRLYRTGDIGRYRADGTIEIVGRIDRQVKIRGHRVEPAEIEAVLRRHPRVADSVVVATHNRYPPEHRRSVSDTGSTITPGSQRLAAFVVLTAGIQSDRQTREGSRELSAELRRFLRRNLPEHLVPSAIVVRENFPRTPNGKIDRQALSTMADAGRDEFPPRIGRSTIDPRTPAERLLTQIWKQVLRIDRLGIDDNFFDLGGDSLLSLEVLSWAHEAGLKIELKQLFQRQTIAELAEVAGAVIASPDGAAPPAIAQPQHRDADSEMVLVTAESLRAYGREALERAGLAAEGARIVTEVQLEASLRGQPTHNIASLPRYARRIAAGTINPNPRIAIERETAVSALVDGDGGPGQWVASIAMQTAIGKARASGVGVVAVRRSNHLGAAGHYVWIAAREGLIGLCTTNGPVILAPTGGVTPTFGNNPLAVGIPAGSHHPILLDIAMSVAPRGKIAVQVADGKPLPPGWILDRFGRPSTDLADLAAGLGVPIGEHKGYGLALVLEVLSGVLSGAGFGLDHRREQVRQTSEPPDLGHFFFAIDPRLFMPPVEFTSRVERLIEETKTGRRAVAVDEILIPGEAELRSRDRSLQEGVLLRRSAYETLRRYAREAGLTAPLAVIRSQSARMTAGG